MGVVAMITAEVGDTSQYDSLTLDYGAIAIDTTTARTGTASFKHYHSGVAGSARALGLINLPARSDYYLRLGIRPTNMSNSGSPASDPRLLQFCEGGTLHLYFWADLYGGIAYVAHGGGTILGSFALSLHMWQCWEIYLKVHDTSGVVTVKRDGTTVLDRTNVDTRNGGTLGQINLIKVGPERGGLAILPDTYYDDIIVRDDAWPGQGGIYVLVPNGAGSDAGWTASAGQPYQCVDEKPPDFTDYIYADGGIVGTKHTFACEDLAVAVSDIRCVSVYTYAKLDSAGAGYIRSIAKSGATYASGTTVGLDVNARYAKLFMTTDPNTGTSWTLSGLNALEAGVETQ